MSVAVCLLARTTVTAAKVTKNLVINLIQLTIRITNNKGIIKTNDYFDALRRKTWLLFTSVINSI